MTAFSDQGRTANPDLRLDDIDYLRGRETAERLLAASAAVPSVRDAHFQMAERYADAVWSAEEQASDRRRRL